MTQRRIGTPGTDGFFFFLPAWSAHHSEEAEAGCYIDMRVQLMAVARGGPPHRCWIICDRAMTFPSAEERLSYTGVLGRVRPGFIRYTTKL